VAPETVKPVPVSVTALTVTDRLPVDFKVTDCVTGVFIATFPNARVVALVVNVRVAGINCSARVLVTLPALAVKVAEPEEVAHHVTAAEKVVVVAPAGTTTLAGTVTAVDPLLRLTDSPPLGAAFVRVNVHRSCNDPARLVEAHESPLSAGVVVAAIAVPLKLTTAVLPFILLSLVIVREPLAAPVAVGRN